MDAIERLIAEDPGQRGVAALAIAGDLGRAAASLVKAKRVLLLSGFHIPRAGAAETDGPPGAWDLANALNDLGASVSTATDSVCWRVFEGMGFAPLLPAEEAAARANEFDHVVAIERPGRAADGRSYTMNATPIPDVFPFDDLVAQCRMFGVSTIAIGDGGNEIGMGKASAAALRSIPRGETIASVTKTDHLIVGGTSNWGAWGLIAALSMIARKNLLPSEDAARATLERAVSAGAVDGVTALREPTVDGLTWPVHASMLRRLTDLVAAALADHA